ncbi:restriction endonuclease [Pseudomonas syringae CC1557]|uniref:Restriction endonuclease n=1 Tax=Pseudomonas syringae CC1557 TaxID=1357279 RepID=W0MVM9_PSESX|nr:HNH endonuclease [Pseudomonas syringae]AHG41088.1 restriction endonuclease [Pseudomonas syringae CC1557]
MQRDDIEAAVLLFRSGVRPFSYRRPNWFFIAGDGIGYPLKYIYAMALGIGSLNTNTSAAKRQLVELGYDIFRSADRSFSRVFSSEIDLSDDSGLAELRIPAEQLRKVTADHIWAAVQALLHGVEAIGFGPSVDYDLLVEDGVRLAPKQVFGLAATLALGFTVGPGHFHGGLNTVCFELLEAAGYTVIAKGEQPKFQDAPIDIEEKVWLEGSKKLVSHLRRERKPGLAQAKKASFIKKHGKLRCEQCLLDPVKTYGEYGDACIEVHHDTVLISEMNDDHATTLDQVRCLCANCHRVVHRALREQLKSDSSTAVA